MNDELEARVGTATPRLTSTGRQSGWEVEVWHDGLNEYRVLSHKDLTILQNKVNAQLARWDDKWQRKRAADGKRERREQGTEGASQATAEAEAALQACEEILSHTLSIDDRVEWEALKDKTPFRQPAGSTDGIEYEASTGRPARIRKPMRPSAPAEPAKDVQPKLSLIDRLIPPLKRRKHEKALAAYEGAMTAWQSATEQWQLKIRGLDAQDRELEQFLAGHQKTWEKKKQDYEKKQAEANAEVDRFKAAYEQGGSEKPEVIEEHAELVLNNSQYPDWIEPDFELAYNQENGIMVVEYELPEPRQLPSLQKVTYVASRDEQTEKHLTARQQESLYDRVCYQIAIRTIHELYEADEIDTVTAIVFNGWVEALDSSSGNMQRSCIMSVQAAKDEFQGLNLSEVEPKACFRRLKGVAASKLAGVAPVQPILQFDRGDSRFVASKEVAAGMTSSTNLATMPWEDFEHLIRELFEQEFAVNGGEVRVTQASRDGGVDAIAFDPDPVRGGKIVIQAKRYTNTVGVAAVRDLYGTVLNEGANKGLLVTTADYGPDSYEFAKDKPLTLLNGSNLLSLLEKHGHRARIDIKEARAALND